MKHCSHILLVALALVATWVAVGCRSMRTVAPTDEGRSTEQPTEQPTVATHRPYTVIQFTAAAEGLNVSGQLRVAEDSAMWVSVNKFIEVGRALATVDSVYLHAPLLGMEQATDYATLSQRMGRTVDYATLQQMALSPDAERLIAEWVAALGYTASLNISQRRMVDSLSFPFTKPSQP